MAANTTTAANTTAANTNVDDPKTSYENAKKELMQAIQRKRQLDKQLVGCTIPMFFIANRIQVALETQIYQLEGTYIAETAGTGGNIIHGFENYLKSTGTSRKRVEVLDHDRVFSQSSITYKKVGIGHPVGLPADVL